MLLTCIAVHIQAQTPTQEQLELLQSLPEQQRQELLEDLGLSQGGISGQEGLEFPDLVNPLPDIEEPQPQAPVISGRDTLILSIAESEALPVNAEASERLGRLPLLRQLLGSRVYVTDTDGVLRIEGIAEIPLNGLDAEEIEVRVSAEPIFEGLTISAQILPLAPSGTEQLDYFGYELFEGVPTTFAPATDIPVPANYVIGVGDEIRLDYFGKENSSRSVVVGRDGAIQLESLGPVSVAGLSFVEMREEISRRVQEQKIGVQVSVTLGELRSIRIFVLGDVNRPGSYVVSSLSTMTNALFVSGGVRRSGSLRGVELKRSGRVVGELDLYDLLLAGDTRRDRRLQPGDVIFVPPVGDRVGIEGEVERPAYYELKGISSAQDVIELAGGLTPLAFRNHGSIERISESGARKIIDVSLRSDAAKSVDVKDGDLIRISPVLDRIDQSISVAGYVRRPAPYEWREGLRIADVIPSARMLKANADLNYVLIRREIDDAGTIDVLSCDLAVALADRLSDENIELRPRDQISVFPRDVGRGQAIRKILSELETQSSPNSGNRRVEIGGPVRAVGVYPLERDMRISDLIRAAGGIGESAYLERAELTRYSIDESGRRVTQLIEVDLRRALEGDLLADELLLSYDYLAVREIPEWRGQQTVTLEGEVRFPGVYPVKRGETLGSVIQRAGGVTELAFPAGSVFTRQTLKQREEDQIELLIGRLEADLAAYSLQSISADANAQQAFALGQQLLGQLRESRATGRLVIDLDRILRGEKSRGAIHDVQLKSGDRLIIPRISQEVTVIGEVQYATSHIFDQSLDRSDYISRSGGITSKADEKRIYVVRANGEVVASSGNRWLRNVGGTEIRPGDTIVVPLDADRLAPLTLWSSVTQIVYNLAVAVAAVNSF